MDVRSILSADATPGVFSRDSRDPSVHMVRMPVPEVVTLRGSLRTGPDLAAGEELLQDLTVALLDAGTRRHDRFEIAEFLEDRGAQIDFSSDGTRIGISVRSLRRHLPDVLELLAELLREPTFSDEEVAKAKSRMEGGLRRALDNAGHRAAVGLAQRLFTPDHPNYAFSAEQELETLARLSADDARRFHASRIGSESMILVLTGDIDEAGILSSIDRCFGDWAPPVHREPFGQSGLWPQSESVRIQMEDKTNLEVRLGHTLSLRRSDPEYLPAYVASFVLGGNFSSRLMSSVRDEQGLTYGIRSALSGVTHDYEGHWNVAVTLSADKLWEGLAATRKELDRLVEEGISQAELAEHQGAITGTFQVSLSTTGGMASTVLHGLENHLGADHIHRFPETIQALNAEEVTAAARALFRPAELVEVIAGTLPTP